MLTDLLDLEDDFMDEDCSQNFPMRKPSRSRRLLDEYMEEKRLKQHLRDDYDYDFDDTH